MKCLFAGRALDVFTGEFVQRGNVCFVLTTGTLNSFHVRIPLLKIRKCLTVIMFCRQTKSNNVERHFSLFCYRAARDKMAVEHLGTKGEIPCCPAYQSDW